MASITPETVDGATYGEALSFTVTVNGSYVGMEGPGVARAEIALFHDGVRLGRQSLYGVPPIE